MAKKKSTNGKPRIPKVRIAEPKNRPMQLRYFSPTENREIRISTGTHDEDEAERQKAELEAKLLLGIAPKREPKKITGPNMSWEYFRDRYTNLQLVTLRAKPAVDAESRLDVAGRILKPRTLADVANSDALHTLQTKLLAGVESRFGKRKTPDGDTVWIQRPRSPHTVKGYMTATMTALNWAAYMEWLPGVPKVCPVKVSKLNHMKGRPLVGEEFDRMLAVTEGVVGAVAAESWRYVLSGFGSRACVWASL